MIGIKEGLTLLVIVFSSTISLCQKYFEGKAVTDISYSNTPENMKSSLIPTQSVWYYKKNKSRYESNSIIKQGDKTISYSSTMIFDYVKGDWMMLMDMPIYNLRTATLHNISKINAQNYKTEKLDDFKEILGHKCQKIIVISSVNNIETKISGYADMNYEINAGIDENGYSLNSPLFFESETEMATTGTIITKIVSLNEGIYDDSFFSLDCPSGYKLTDSRKSFNNGIKEEQFENISINELETKLAEALKIEDFDKAARLKDVIEKRGGSLFKYKSKTIAELQEMLKKAVTTEDFDTATQIQEEIKKRG